MKAKIIKVVEDYPFVTVYYESGFSREYNPVWDVPETVLNFKKKNANKVNRDNNGCKVWTMC